MTHTLKFSFIFNDIHHTIEKVMKNCGITNYKINDCLPTYDRTELNVSVTFENEESSKQHFLFPFNVEWFEEDSHYFGNYIEEMTLKLKKFIANQNH